MYFSSRLLKIAFTLGLTCGVVACSSGSNQDASFLGPQIRINDDCDFGGPNCGHFEFTIGHITSGDINGDGVADILGITPFITGFSSTIITMISDGNGYFPTRDMVLGLPGHGNKRLRVGDLNNDNHLDIVGVTTGGEFTQGKSGIFTSFGDGAGNFTDEIHIEIGSVFSNIQLADVDDDSDLDIVAYYNAASPVLYFLENKGDGTFLPSVDNYPLNRELYFQSQSTLLTSGDSTGYYGNIADIDGDGNLDVVSVVDNSEFNIQFGDGEGGFLKAVSSPLDRQMMGRDDPQVFTVYVNNFDRDPLPEILISTRERESQSDVRLFIFHVL